VPIDLLRIIRRADGYSAGERALTHLYGETATGDLALDSMFTMRDLGRPLADDRRFYVPGLLSPEVAFPQLGVEPLTSDVYGPVQDGFVAAYREALSRAQGWAELEAWTYSLLERFTWAVPSALQKVPRDVSLFDHARTSCAIAAALYLRRHAGRGDRGSKVFLLVKGDVSGVQDYIYSVANVGPGGVAKRLRARSFFVTALTEVVSHWLREGLVDACTLPLAATIFAGGGQFVLLAPNLKSALTNLAQIEEQVNRWLWNEFQGDLALVFGVEQVAGTELAIKPRKKGRNICDVLRDLDDRVSAAKDRRLERLLQADGQWQPDAFLWAPPGKDYEHGACPSCDRLPARAGDEEENIDKRL
jgi:CRISPR-associated protein Csm1